MPADHDKDRNALYSYVKLKKKSLSHKNIYCYISIIYKYIKA